MRGLDLTFEIEKQIIKRTDIEKAVKCSDNYLILNFSFSKDWEGFVKFALIRVKGETTRLAISEDGKVTVPASLLTENTFVVSPYGINEEEEIIRITTNECVIHLRDTGFTTKYTDDIPPSEVDVVEAIYLRIKEVEDELEDYSPIGHKHTESDITDLKEYSVVGHTHSVSDVTDVGTVCEEKSNKVTSLSSSSTDTQYPSAKSVYDAIKKEIAGSADMILVYDASFDTTFRSFNTTPFGFTGELTIDWGDGNTETYTSGRLLHSYSSEETYIIRISGNIHTLNQNCFKQELEGLKKIIIPTTVTSIGEYAFFQCRQLTTIDIPESVKTIGDFCFGNCYKLADIKFPDNLTSIPDNCVYGCSGLTTLTFPKNVTSIGDRAAYDCTGLDMIIFEPMLPPTVTGLNYWSSPWKDVPTTCKILVPKGSLTDYTTAPGYPSSSTYTYQEYERNSEDIVLPNLVADAKYPVSSDVLYTVINKLLNRVGVNSDKGYVRKDDKVNINAFVLENGVPKSGVTVQFYKVEE